MLLAERQVTFQVSVGVPGDTSRFDGATFDTSYAFDGGTVAWLEINPQTLLTRVERRLNDAAVWRANLWDPDRILDPSASPYVLGDGVDAQILIDGAPLWTGTVGPNGWLFDPGDYSARLEGTDSAGYLAGYEISDVTYPQHTVASRVNAIMASVPYAGDVEIDGTGATLGTVKMSGDMLSQLKEVAKTDRGYFWSGANGGLMYRTHEKVNPAPPATVHVWDSEDMGAATDGVYESISIGLTPVVNTVDVDRVRAIGAEPSPYIAVSDTSRARYGVRTLSDHVLQSVDDSALKVWADLELARGAIPRVLPTRAVFRIHSQLPYAQRTLDALLGLDLLDSVTVHLTQRGDAQIWQTLVTGIVHDISPEWWTIELSLDTVDIPGAGAFDTALFDTAKFTYSLAG